jgi:nucleotide-binding universal stress UspA family protein
MGSDMPFKNILLHMDPSDLCHERLSAAGELAISQGANLTGLYVTPEPFYPMYAEASFFPEDVLKTFEEEDKETNKIAEKNFREFVTAQSIHNEWYTEHGPLASIVCRYARYADLVVLGKGSIDAPKNYPDPFLAEEVVMRSGRPILIIPNAGHFEGFGKRILVCWNGSREAVRAVNDALPFLQAAEKVTVMVVNPEKPNSGDHGEIPSADIAHYLARHNVKVEAASTKSDQGDAGKIILSWAFDNDASMIVAGAYGHSRTREWILGGVSKTLIHETAVPTFLSH